MSGNALTTVLLSSAQSANAHTLKAYIISNVQVASPGCTKRIQGLKMYHFTVVYGSAQRALQVDAMYMTLRG